MNQEIEGDLEALFLKLQQDTLRATTRHCRLDLRKKAIKAIQELVCSTVPEEKRIESFDASDRSKWGETYLKATQCKADYFNRCRAEIFKKWS